jgi:hypothetical protein
MRKNVVAAGAGCGVLILCVLLVGTFWQLQGLSETEDASEDAIIHVDVPPQAFVGETFSIIVTVQPVSGSIEDVLLHSVDFSNTYLSQVSVLETSPPSEKNLAIPFVGFQTFIFQHSIRPLDTAVIEFTLQADQPTDLSGLMDVCIHTASLCQRFDLQTTVIEAD